MHWGFGSRGMFLAQLKLNKMDVKDLINKLQELPQDIPIRTIMNDVPDDLPNEWVFKVELHETCVADEDNNNKIYQEVVLITNQ